MFTIYGPGSHLGHVTRNILFVLEFYSPVNNKVMSSWLVNSGTGPGQA